jgi:mono/diheme cytochrome c family protein
VRFPASVIAVAAVVTIAAASCQKAVPVDSTPKAAPTAVSTSPAAANVSPPKRDLVPLPPEPLTPPFTQSTLQGVYTEAEAKEGNQVYLGYCASCHAAVSHTGPEFRKHWGGKPLSALYNLMHRTMPQNNPNSLDDYSYGVVLAYILKLNGMPAGKAPIMGDSVDLDKIRMDTVRLGPKSGG